MFSVRLVLLVIVLSASVVASDVIEKVIDSADGQGYAENQSGDTLSQLEALSATVKLGSGLVLAAPPHVIKINKENTQRSDNSTGEKHELNTSVNQQNSSKPTSVQQPIPSKPTTAQTEKLLQIPQVLRATKLQAPVITGNWAFSVINAQKQLITIPVRITSTQILFSYCNNIILNYKINKTAIAVILASQLPKSCPNLSPNQSKILSSMTNVDSFILNGTKLYFQSAGVNKVAFVKL